MVSEAREGSSMKMQIAIEARCWRCGVQYCLLLPMWEMLEVVNIDPLAPIRMRECENCGEVAVKIQGDFDVIVLLNKSS